MSVNTVYCVHYFVQCLFDSRILCYNKIYVLLLFLLFLQFLFESRFPFYSSRFLQVTSTSTLVVLKWPTFTAPQVQNKYSSVTSAFDPISLSFLGHPIHHLYPCVDYHVLYSSYWCAHQAVVYVLNTIYIYIYCNSLFTYNTVKKM